MDVTHTVDMDSELFCSKMEAARDCFLWMNDDSVAYYYGLSHLSKLRKINSTD